MRAGNVGLVLAVAVAAALVVGRLTGHFAMGQASESVRAADQGQIVNRDQGRLGRLEKQVQELTDEVGKLRGRLQVLDTAGMRAIADRIMVDKVQVRGGKDGMRVTLVGPSSSGGDWPYSVFKVGQIETAGPVVIVQPK